MEKSFWDDNFDDIEMSATPLSEERGRTSDRSNVPLVTVGSSLSSESEMRRRPSPVREEFSVRIDQNTNNDGYTPYLEALEADLKDHYPMTNLRNIDQLYFNMIPDIVVLQGASRATTSQVIVYWIKTEHLYWRVLDHNYQDRCVVTKVSTGKKSALLAIGKEFMDEVIQRLWEALYAAGRTYKSVSI